MQVNPRTGHIELSINSLDNVKTLNDIDYEFVRLNPDFEGNRGGNSMIFTLTSEEEEDKVIKICRSIIGSHSDFHRIRLKRFEREISALQKSQTKNFIVKYFFDGILNVNQTSFRYYVMEKAEMDLKDFIINHKPDFQNRVMICRQILNAFTELQTLDIYHRDIKPDNFFYVNDIMKVGDLGLINYRNDDEILDRENELIGPRGWLSPEATNKFMTFNKDIDFEFDCRMDFRSDIFQLGKLFWFIFQYNIPVGRVKRNDFKIKDDQIYSIIAWMLNHDKKRRPHLLDIVNSFSPIFLKYAA